MPFSPGGGGPAINATGLTLADSGSLDGFWYIDHLDHDFNVFQTVRPENLHFTLRESAVQDIDYELSKSSVDVYGEPVWYRNGFGQSFIAPWRTGFRLRNGSTVIMEGFHDDPGIQHAWGSETLSVSGKDYAQYLDMRHYPFDPRPGHRNDWQGLDGVLPTPAGLAVMFRDTDVATIIDYLFFYTLGMVYSMPFTWIVPLTGVTQNWELDLGDTSTLLSIVQQFAEDEPGFEWTVSPDRVIEIFPGKIYGTPELVVALPSAYVIATFDDTVPGGLDGLETLQFGNTGPKWTHFYGSGANLVGTGVSAAFDYPDGMAEFWRIDGTEDLGNVKNRPQLVRLARSRLAFGLNPVHEIPITVRPEVIPDFWNFWKPGKPIYIRLDLGFHLIDSPHEIIEMDVTVANDGQADVKVTLNQIYDTTTVGTTFNPEG